MLLFPPTDQADETGLLVLGGDLDSETIISAYLQGIFPWPINKRLLAWFAPPQRGVLFLKELHCPKSLRREINRKRFTFSIDRDFAGVIKGCAESKNRKGQRGTWITPMMIAAYSRLHQLGIAHSIEVWNPEGNLVGGLYYIRIRNMVAAESMFYLEPHASKLALLQLATALKSEGLDWIDVQMLTSTTELLGAREIPRHEFEILLQEAVR
jgi:leucyl/phenylalanyl-tRNA--protein transferase